MSYNVIYFEGPDFAGKTHLINQIRKPGDLFFHNGVYKSPYHAHKEYMFQIDTVKEIFLQTSAPDLLAIFDRGPIAEQIYGLVMRNEYMSNADYVECTNALFKDLNTLLVICLPPFEIALKGWESRKHIEYVKEKEMYKQIYYSYSIFLEEVETLGNLSNIISYDFTQTAEYKNEHSK